MENDTAKCAEQAYSMKSVTVLDKGFINLVQSSGGDGMVLSAARVSNAVMVGRRTPEEDQKLINYLMKHRHGSPFEHSSFTFHVKVPLFVAREWQRHRIGSYNEISGRYTEFKPEFYIPNTFRIPAVSNKQGSIILDDTSAGEWVDREFERWSREAYEFYKFLLERGLAKEMARMVLPLNLYTQYYWTVNARSLMNFLNLRCAENAQWEIRMFANAIRDEFFHDLMPMTYRAWEENGYLSP